MHPQERQSWFTLAVFGGCFALFVCMLFITGNPARAAGAFALFGLSGFTTLIGRKERREHKVVMDERDATIARTAANVAFGILWTLFVLACMLPWFILPAHATIPVEVLPQGLFVAWALVFSVRAAVTIILYRRGYSPRPEGIHA